MIPSEGGWDGYMMVLYVSEFFLQIVKYELSFQIA
jgi:hypothetical protein